MLLHYLVVTDKNKLAPFYGSRCSKILNSNYTMCLFDAMVGILTKNHHFCLCTQNVIPVYSHTEIKLTNDQNMSLYTEVCIF